MQYKGTEQKRRVVADEFATTLTGWTPTAELALLNQTLQLKNTQKATRTQTVTANKNYNLSLTILKGTACSSSTVTIRIKNGTAIVAQTPITINASSAASIPVSLNFTFPSTSLTLEIERTNFNVATCSALQIDNVYLTEKDWVNETFATIGNTSGYASSMPNALALTNTAQQLQLNYIAPSRGMGVSKKVTLDKDQKYTIGYSFKNKMGISANNFVLLELIKDGSIMYTRKLQATEATTFDYTAPATGEYTWRMRSSSIGTTTTQPLTYSLDNLSIFYTYPYTIENCDNLADGYRFGFNGKEDDRETGTQDYGFRIYNPQIGRFLSVDPLTKIYPSWSPYPFAMNRPIDGVDIDGKEWTSVTEDNVTKFKVVINVYNASTMVTDKTEIENLLHGYTDKEGVFHEGIEQAMEKSYTKTVDGHEYKLDVVLNYVENPTEDKSQFTMILKDGKSIINKDGDMEYTAGTTALMEGNFTQENDIKLNVTLDGVKLDITEIGKTGAHELGHTGGLPHPWDKKASGTDVDQNAKDANLPAIKNNLLNSDENPKRDMRNSKGTNITGDQLKQIKNNVESQQPKK
jgi:RHS repeat-associated protein